MRDGMDNAAANKISEEEIFNEEILPNMGNATRFIRAQIDAFYETGDQNSEVTPDSCREEGKHLEEVLDSGSEEKLSEFITTYILQFPSLGDIIFQYIYDKDPTLIRNEKGDPKFPPLADLYFKYIFDKDSTLKRSKKVKPELPLSKKYADYTLHIPLGKAKPEDDYAAFYHKYLKTEINPVRHMRDGDCEIYINAFLKYQLITEAQAAMLRKDCAEPFNKFRENPYRTHLDQIKGYECFGRSDLSHGIRNLIFHLAFTLDMDDGKVRKILTKGLLMQDFDPRDHKELIYRWCLKHHISYQNMMLDYMAYYHSAAFADKYRREKIADIYKLSTEYLIDQVSYIFDRTNFDTPEQQQDAFWAYLWRIKVFEENISNPAKAPKEADLYRKTPSEVFWDNFLDFPEKIYTASGQEPPKLVTFDDFRRNKFGLLKNEPLPDSNSQDDDAVFRLKILEQSRANYYLSNPETLLPVSILKELFKDIDYTSAAVLKRKSGEVPISRNLLIATMFIGYFSDYEYQLQENLYGKEAMYRFINSLTLSLGDCGLFPFYMSNPFELFLALCFLFKDPLGYFLSSWEEALRSSWEEALRSS